MYLCSVGQVHACGSGLTISSVTLSASSVALGNSFNVTVVYQQAAGWNQTYFLGGFNLSQTTFQACGTPNQVFNLYTGVDGTGNTANPPSGNGWGPLNPGGTGPATAVFAVTASASLTPGTTYNYIVGVSGCDAQCGDLANMEAQSSAPISILLPPPSCSVTVMTEGVTTAPGGLFLFDVDYNFVNSGSSNVVYSLPTGVTYVSAGPNAVYNSGSNSVSWNLGNISAPKISALWAILSVPSNTANGTVFSNVATLNSANCGSSSSNTANLTVQAPQLALTKTQNVPSLAAGAVVTYGLNWTANGQNLEFYDSYDNAVSGTTTTGSPEPWGYDGTNYTVVPAAGDPGTWVASADSNGQPLISGSVLFDSSGEAGAILNYFVTAQE